MAQKLRYREVDHHKHSTLGLRPALTPHRVPVRRVQGRLNLGVICHFGTVSPASHPCSGQEMCFIHFNQCFISEPCPLKSFPQGQELKIGPINIDNKHQKQAEDAYALGMTQSRSSLSAGSHFSCRRQDPQSGCQPHPHPCSRLCDSRQCPPWLVVSLQAGMV